MIKDLIERNRSYRRFDDGCLIEKDTLRELVELARLSGSASNMQPLKYMLSCESKRNAVIFDYLAWAGYLTDWAGPGEAERPTGYIIILGDKRISKDFGCDHGIAAQSILLGAVERGLGGCMIGSIDRKGLRESLDIDGQLEILLVIALGKPSEKVLLEELGTEGNIQYYRDGQGVHHVPKRFLEEIIVK